MYWYTLLSASNISKYEYNNVYPYLEATMKSSSPSVVFVSTDTEHQYAALCLLATRAGFDAKQASTVSDLFSLLNDAKNQINLVLFDIDTLYNSNEADIFDIINTVSTLSKCSHKKASPTLSIVVNDKTDPAKIRDAMATDIKGFIYNLTCNSVNDNIFAIKELLTGKSYTDKAIIEKIKPTKRNSNKKYSINVKGIELTVRQEQILKLICDRGSSNKQIARLLNLSESTIKLHIGAILKKYGLRNRTQLALFAKGHYSKT